MNKQEQIECFNNLVEKQREVMLSKGDDYANEDRLSNFKSAAYICGLSTEQHCLAMIATKVARLGVLLDPSAPTPKHESVEDSILDLANYAHLLNMIVLENKPQAKEATAEDCCGQSDENRLCTCKTVDSKYDDRILFGPTVNAVIFEPFLPSKRFTAEEAREITKNYFGNDHSENFYKLFKVIN